MYTIAKHQCSCSHLGVRNDVTDNFGHLNRLPFYLRPSRSSSRLVHRHGFHPTLPLGLLRLRRVRDHRAQEQGNIHESPSVDRTDELS